MSAPGLRALGTVLSVALLPTACFFHLDEPIRRGAAGGRSGVAVDGSPPDSGGSPAGGTSGSGGTAGTAAGAAPGGTAGSGGGCAPGTKRCGADCVHVDDPAYGCRPADCMPCPGLTTASFACTNGNCAIVSCLAGLGDCNGSDDDGCEIRFDDLPKPSPPPASVDARRATGTITIDGFATEADWIATAGQRQTIADPCFNCGVQDPIPPIAVATAPPPEDLSAWFRTAWDDHYLYALVEVRDDMLISKPWMGDGKLWPSAAQDAVELLISSDGSKGGYGVDDMQLFFPLSGPIGRPNQATPTAENEFHVLLGHGCYTVELRLSFSYMTANRNFIPTANQVLGFTAAVDDWDERKTEAGLVPERQSHLFSKSPGDGYWYGTDGFASLRLLGP